jgi:hypothetical protein
MIQIIPRFKGIISQRSIGVNQGGINLNEQPEPEEYVGPALIQTPNSIYQPKLIVDSINPIRKRKMKKNLV